MDQTFQSRLAVELRRAHVHDIEAANLFLNSYLKKFNKQFSLRLNTIKSVYEKQPTVEKINQTLAIISKRKIDSDNSIKYKNIYYLSITENNTVIYAVPKQTCLVIESFDKKLYVNIDDQLFMVKEVLKHEIVSKNFNNTLKEEEIKKPDIPPMTHPWKQDS